MLGYQIHICIQVIDSNPLGYWPEAIDILEVRFKLWLPKL